MPSGKRCPTLVEKEPDKMSVELNALPVLKGKT